MFHGILDTCHGFMIHEVLFQAGNHSVSYGISGRNQGSPLHHFSHGFSFFFSFFSFFSFSGECHGSMIHEVLFQAGKHSVSCGISGRNQGSPGHHFSQGFPHFENEVPACSIVYLQ